MQETYTAEQFKRLLNQGAISIKGKRLKMEELPPDYVETINHVNSIFIPGEVYSSKNSKRIFPKAAAKYTGWTFRNKNVVPFITSSTAVNNYKSEIMRYYTAYRQNFLDMIRGKVYPLFLEFHFVRATKAGWDFNNMSQLVCDMMVKAGWVPDDNVKILFPVPPMPPLKPYSIDKKNPGVFIRVL